MCVRRLRLEFRVNERRRKKQQQRLVTADQCTYLSIAMCLNVRIFYTVGGIINRLPNRKQFNLDFMVIDLKKTCSQTRTHIRSAIKYQRVQEIDRHRFDSKEDEKEEDLRRNKQRYLLDYISENGNG